MRRILAWWYLLLLLLLCEILLYWITGLTADLCRRALWDRFNAGARQLENVSGIPYADKINRQAELRNTSARLIGAVIQAESSFQPRAVSQAGAYGLMQIIPSTWQKVNAEIGACTGRHAGDCSPECYFNPDLNIAVGTAYLAQLSARYNGNMVMAVAAYNAGPQAVDKYSGIPPYKETNEYVGRVIDNWYEIGGMASPSWRSMTAWLEGMRSCIRLGLLITLVGIGCTFFSNMRRYRSWRWR